MKTWIATILLCSFALSGCAGGTFAIWKNDHIETVKREALRSLNDKLFAALSTNNMTTIRALMSDPLRAQEGAQLDTMLLQVGPYFKKADYRILDEYDVQNSAENITNTVASGISGDHDYVINYKALNKEMYISLLLPQAADNELLTTVIWGKWGKEWKINFLHFGSYSILKKTAPDLLKMAKERYSKSHLIDAVNYIGLAMQCIKPAGTHFHYQKEGEIQVFYEKAMKEVNAKYTFPITLNAIATKPQIFRVYPEAVDSGIYPMVYYLSTLKLEDTIALKSENEQVQKEIGRLFEGIDQDKKFVFYWVFKEIPDGKKRVRHYGFVDRLD